MIVIRRKELQEAETKNQLQSRYTSFENRNKATEAKIDSSITPNFLHV